MLYLAHTPEINQALSASDPFQSVATDRFRSVGESTHDGDCSSIAERRAGHMPIQHRPRQNDEC